MSQLLKDILLLLDVGVTLLFYACVIGLVAAAIERRRTTYRKDGF